MKFSDWLLRQTARKDRIGGLAKEMAEDPNWPRTQDIGTYVRYVESHGAGPEVQEVVRQAWREWNAQCGRDRRKSKRKAARTARKRNRRN